MGRKPKKAMNQAQKRQTRPNGDEDPIRNISTQYYSAQNTLDNRCSTSGRGDENADAAAPVAKINVGSLFLRQGTIIDTLVPKMAIVRELSKGFDLEDIPNNFGCYQYPWNARSFANKVSTQFSSFKLSEGLEDYVGTTDFISDWENIKSLITTPFNTESRSFLLHRVGKSIFVDAFDLKKFFGPKLYSCEWSWLRNYAEEVAGPHRKVILQEGKSPEKIYAKAAFHKLLYFGVDEKIEVEEQYDKNNFSWESDHLPPPPDIKIEGNANDIKFLHKVKWDFGEHSMLVGTNIPVFRTKEGENKLTLTAVDDADKTQNIPLEDGLDTWLNNNLMGVNETLVTYHKDRVVVGTKRIKTACLPQEAGFDSDKLIDKREGSILDFLKTNVVDSGHTYWFYKAPGTAKFDLYDLTKLSEEKNQPGNSDVSNPYMLAVASLLYRSVYVCKKQLKLTTMDSMLKHTISIIGAEYRDITAAAKYLLVDIRTQNDQEESNIVTLLNGDMSESSMGNSFNYNWQGETSMSTSTMKEFNEECPELAVLLCIEKVTIDKKATVVMNELDIEFDASDNEVNTDLEVADPAVLTITRHIKSDVHNLNQFSKIVQDVPTESFIENLRWSTNTETGRKKGKCSAEEEKLRKYGAKIQKERFKSLQQRLQDMYRPAVNDNCVKLLQSFDKILPGKKLLTPSKWILACTCTRLIFELISAIRTLEVLIDEERIHETNEKLSKYQLLLFHVKNKLGLVLQNLTVENLDEDICAVAVNLSITFLHENLQRRKDKDGYHYHISKVISNCIDSHLLKFQNCLNDTNSNQNDKIKALKPKNTIKDILCKLSIATANPYAKHFPSIPDVPVFGNERVDYHEWSLQVLEQIQHAELYSPELSSLLGKQGAVCLQKAGGALVQYLESVHLDIYDITQYRHLRGFMFAALKYFEEAYDRFLKHNDPFSTFVACLDMVEMYDKIRNLCSRDIHILEEKHRKQFSLLEAFKTVEKSFLAVSKLNWTDDLIFNRIMWELSSLHLSQAFFCLDSLHVMSSEKIDENSYSIFLDHLNFEEKYISEIRSNKFHCLNNPDLLTRSAVVLTLRGDILRKKILIAAEMVHVRFKELKSKWEPYQPDVIEQITLRRNQRNKKLLFDMSSRIGSRSANILMDPTVKSLCEEAIKVYNSAYQTYDKIGDPFLVLVNFLRLKDVENFDRVYAAAVSGGFDTDENKSSLHYFKDMLPKVKNLQHKWDSNAEYRNNLDINYSVYYDVEANCKTLKWITQKTESGKLFLLDVAPFPVLFRIFIRLWNSYGRRVIEENVKDEELAEFANKINHVISKYQPESLVANEDDLLSLALHSFDGVTFRLGGEKKEAFHIVLNELVDVLEFANREDFCIRWINRNNRTVERDSDAERKILHGRKRSKCQVQSDVTHPAADNESMEQHATESSNTCTTKFPEAGCLIQIQTDEKENSNPKEPIPTSSSETSKDKSMHNELQGPTKALGTTNCSKKKKKNKQKGRK